MPFVTLRSFFNFFSHQLGEQSEFCPVRWQTRGRGDKMKFYCCNLKVFFFFFWTWSAVVYHTKVISFFAHKKKTQNVSESRDLIKKKKIMVHYTQIEATPSNQTFCILWKCHIATSDSHFVPPLKERNINQRVSRQRFFFSCSCVPQKNIWSCKFVNCEYAVGRTHIAYIPNRTCPNTRYKWILQRA